MKMTLRKRLLILTMLPLAIGIVLLLYVINSSIEPLRAKHGVRLDENILFSQQISAVVHELQKERGLTASFLAQVARNIVNYWTASATIRIKLLLPLQGDHYGYCRQLSRIR